jgi:hypothetical protein
VLDEWRNKIQPPCLGFPDVDAFELTDGHRWSNSVHSQVDPGMVLYLVFVTATQLEDGICIVRHVEQPCCGGDRSVPNARCVHSPVTVSINAWEPWPHDSAAAAGSSSRSVATLGVSPQARAQATSRVDSTWASLNAQHMVAPEPTHQFP